MSHLRLFFADYFGKGAAVAPPPTEAGEEQAEEEQPGQEPATAKGPLALGASVGRGGKNQPEDVLAVQQALNRRLDAGLSENGKGDGKTLAAIEDFQRR